MASKILKYEIMAAWERLGHCYKKHLSGAEGQSATWDLQHERLLGHEKNVRDNTTLHRFV